MGFHFYAGILMYRQQSVEFEFLLTIPDRRFRYLRQSAGAWSIPMAYLTDLRYIETIAKREFLAQTGITVNGDLTTGLSPIQYTYGALAFIWAVEYSVDTTDINGENERKLSGNEYIAKWFRYQDAINLIEPEQVKSLKEVVRNWQYATNAIHLEIGDKVRLIRNVYERSPRNGDDFETVAVENTVGVVATFEAYSKRIRQIADEANNANGVDIHLSFDPDKLLAEVKEKYESGQEVLVEIIEVIPSPQGEVGFATVGNYLNLPPVCFEKLENEEPIS
jgi:hypothetical protein